VLLIYLISTFVFLFSPFFEHYHLNFFLSLSHIHILFFFFFFFLSFFCDRVSLCSPGYLWSSSPQLLSAGITGVRHHTYISHLFLFLSLTIFQRHHLSLISQNPHLCLGLRYASIYIPYLNCSHFFLNTFGNSGIFFLALLIFK
jgi:hypothetical protein